jgi:hypothetical protein
MADIARPWSGTSTLAGLTHRSLLAGTLDRPFTDMSDDYSEHASNVQVSSTRILHKPPELTALNGVYPPGSLVYIRREDRTRSLYYMARNWAPTLATVGHELSTLPMINMMLARMALDREDDAVANAMYTVDEACKLFALDGATQGMPTGDSGAPAGSYMQGNQKITVDVVTSGPISIWDVWGSQALDLCNGSKLFLIMKKVPFPQSEADFKFALDPRGSPAISSGNLHGKLRQAGISKILQVIPYAPSGLDTGSGFPPMSQTVFRDPNGSLKEGAVWNVGRIHHASYRSFRASRPDPDRPFDWKDYACTRELSNMIALPQVHVLMDARRILHPI